MTTAEFTLIATLPPRVAFGVNALVGDHAADRPQIHLPPHGVIIAKLLEIFGDNREGANLLDTDVRDDALVKHLKGETVERHGLVASF